MDRDQQSGTGLLRIRVGTARGAIPVEGAVVRIREYGTSADSGNVLYTLRTDRNGNTETVSLSAPPASESHPDAGGEIPYAEYNLTVERNGFYASEYSRVPVFDGITSVQPVDLIPISEFSDETQAGPRDRTGHEGEV